jgi:hypothetical protein
MQIHRLFAPIKHQRESMSTQSKFSEMLRSPLGYDFDLASHSTPISPKGCIKLRSVFRR